MLGLRSAPKLDTATSAAEVVLGVPLRIPGICFETEQHPQSLKDQLKLARDNVDKFSPATLDLRRFKDSPFIAATLRTAKYIFVRDNRLGKPGLAPKYTGPFKVLNRDWDNNIFRLDFGRKEDSVALSRLKAATVPIESG